MARHEYHHYSFIKSKADTKSIKDKTNEVKKYLIRYRKSLIEIQYYDALSLRVTDERGKLCDKEKLIQYTKYIEDILSVLSEESQEYLKNEYINSNNNSKWWMTKYNRSTFFKIKKNAIEEFLLYV